MSDGAGFEAEIINFQEERRQQLIKAISVFEQEKQKLEKDKDTVLSVLNKQLLHLENSHAENEAILNEAKDAIEKLDAFYGEFSEIVDVYIHQMQSGARPENVKNLYNENKKIFIKSIADLKQPKFIKKNPKVKFNSQLQPSGISYGNINAVHHYPDHKKEYPGRAIKLNRYKIASFFLSLLWIATLLFFLWPKAKTSGENTVIQQLDTITSIAVTKQVKLPDLTPLPNSSLNARDVQKNCK